MVQISFIWLLASHLTVLFPCYIGITENRDKWLHTIISMVITAFFSTIYHIVDLPNIEKNEFVFLGLRHNVYTGIDFFGSYFSILTILLSVIHPKIISDYYDKILVIIAYLSCFFSITEIPWYYFILFSFIFCLFYSIISKETSIYYILISLYNFRLYSFLGFITLFLSIFMQYFFALDYDTDNYPTYHGFWHFFMFLSSGFWMKWNNQLIEYNKKEIIIQESDSE